MSLRAICQCGRRMLPEENGVNIELTEAGNEHYRVRVSGDKWKCPDCGNQVYIGFGREVYPEEPVFPILEPAFHARW